MKTVLISTLGKTPQVLCETVWALANEPTPIVPDEIVAVSMENYSGEASQKIFGKHGGWQMLLKALRKVHVNTSGKLRISNIMVASDAFGVIEDLRTEEDNLRCANYLFELIRSYVDTADNARLIFSLSGGRKSLAALSTVVMSLLARPQDTLVHLIADANLEDGQYHFPPHAQGYHLFEVPFLRTRGLLKSAAVDKARTFEECLRVTQGVVVNIGLLPELTLDVDRGTIQVGARNSRPERMDPCRFMLLWLVCVYRRLNRPEFEDAICQVHQDKISAAGYGGIVPAWFRNIRDKNRVQPIYKLVKETKEVLAKFSGIDQHWFDKSLFPRPPNRYMRDSAITYPAEKLVVYSSGFSCWLKSRLDGVLKM